MIFSLDKFLPCKQTDILLFQRRKAAPSKPSGKKQRIEEIIPEQLEEMNIEDFIVGELEQSDRQLEIFDGRRIATALEDYVQKQQAQAIPETVTALLGKQQKKLIHHGSADAPEKASEDPAHGEDGEDEAAAKQVKRSQKVSHSEREFENVENGSKPSAGRTIRRTGTTNSKTRRNISHATPDSDVESDEPVDEIAKRSSRRAGRGRALQVAEEDNDDYIEEVSPPKRRAPAQRRTNSKRASALTADDDDIDSDDEEFGDDKPPIKKQTSSRARTKRNNTPTSSRSEGRSSQSQLSFAPINRNSTSRKRGRAKDGSDEDEVPKNTTSGSYDLDEDWGTAKTDTFQT